MSNMDFAVTLSFDIKMKVMKQVDAGKLKMEHLRWDVEKMKRLLCFIMEENIHLKYKLAAILSRDYSKQQLEQLEKFHSSFIMQDKFNGMIKSHMMELNKLLDKESSLNTNQSIRSATMIEKVCTELNIAEAKAKKLKRDFNIYLLENIKQ